MDAVGRGANTTDITTDAEIARSAARNTPNGGHRELQRVPPDGALDAACPQASSSNGTALQESGQQTKVPDISLAEADRLAAEIEEARKQRLAYRPAEEPGDIEPGSEVDALDE
ncbi:hypothetical protein WJX81_007944 [Elliptochloris bilobata]|uniref:Uncharacterized protein n=1 Tax=Elliptochloris bilobata TaxID=381761 RepID=A0AAW1QN18_9CHLO